MGQARMTTTDTTTRPGLAIIANTVTPYRVNLHCEIAARIPELQLHTLISHGAAEFDWKVPIPAEINAHFMGSGDMPLATIYHAPLREWRKGGRLIEYLEAHDVRAVICSVPRYLSYLRVVMHGRSGALPVFVRSDANIKNEQSISPLKSFVKQRFHRLWLRQVRGVMSMGSYGDEFFAKYGVDRRRMYRVPYWPDFDYFAQADVERVDQFCRKFGLRRDRRYFVFSGRLAQVKRVDLLIQAFVRIAADRPEWDLLIVGDGALRDELRSMVPSHLQSRVVWTGFLDHNEPALAYHAADVLVLPSDREPWAVVVQEAMAAGLPVIASDVVGAAHEMVKDGTSGRIFPAGNVEALAAAMHDVSQAERLTNYRQHVREDLETWRRENDPIVGIRRALADVGVLPRASEVAPPIPTTT
jgi:glycosyltransferase involved in cell wall biosynthesis